MFEETRIQYQRERRTALVDQGLCRDCGAPGELRWTKTYPEGFRLSRCSTHAEEHKEQAIQEFTVERLQTYYIHYPDIAKPAFHALSEARQLISRHPTASFIFSAISIEVGIKVTLLKPVVYGLVHSESLAAIITDKVIRQTSIDRFQKLLFKILSEYGGIDLNTLKRTKSSKLLWDEMKNVQNRRNQVIHRAENVDISESKQALSIAKYILENIFPNLVEHLKLNIGKEGSVNLQ